jgi:hypothetical protein
MAQKTLPFGTLESLAVRVDCLSLPFLARPMPLTSAFSGNIGVDADCLHLFQYRTAVVSLVSHYSFDAVWFTFGVSRGAVSAQLRGRFTRLRKASLCGRHSAARDRGTLRRTSRPRCLMSAAPWCLKPSGGALEDASPNTRPVAHEKDEEEQIQ